MTDIWWWWWWWCNVNCVFDLHVCRARKYEADLITWGAGSSEWGCYGVYWSYLTASDLTWIRNWTRSVFFSGKELSCKKLAHNNIKPAKICTVFRNMIFLVLCEAVKPPFLAQPPTLFYFPPLFYLLTYLITYLFSLWSRVLLEKLTGSQLVKKFPAFYGTPRFISAFTNARHLSLSWASSIQAMSPYPTFRDSS